MISHRFGSELFRAGNGQTKICPELWQSQRADDLHAEESCAGEGTDLEVKHIYLRKASATGGHSHLPHLTPRLMPPLPLRVSLK